MPRTLVPSSARLKEHHCCRWLPVSVLKILEEEQLNIAKDMERARELRKMREIHEYTQQISPIIKAENLTSELIKRDFVTDYSLTLDDASLIRAKAKAMAAAAEERLKLEEEIYQKRLRSTN